MTISSSISVKPLSRSSWMLAIHVLSVGRAMIVTESVKVVEVLNRRGEHGSRVLRAIGLTADAAAAVTS